LRLERNRKSEEQRRPNGVPASFLSGKHAPEPGKARQALLLILENRPPGASGGQQWGGRCLLPLLEQPRTVLTASRVKAAAGPFSSLFPAPLAPAREPAVHQRQIRTKLIRGSMVLQKNFTARRSCDALLPDCSVFAHRLFYASGELTLDAAPQGRCSQRIRGR
jgi:hypothetical protein